MSLTKIGSIGINTGIAFAGVTTITTLNGSDAVLSVGGTVNFVSDVSIGGTVSIAGTLTYEDVTNVDAVGLITARDGINVGSGITLSVDGDVFFTGIATGNGSGLTALNASNLGSGTVPTARLGSGTASSSTFLAGDSTFKTVTGTTINNNADNRLITGSGTANTLEGESTLTYDAGGMNIAGDTDRDGIKITQSGNNYGEFNFNSNRSAAGNALGIIRGEWNSSEVASIYLSAGDDTTNKDDGQIKFYTSAAGGSIASRMEVLNNGNVKVTDGDLVIGTSGHGIDFSATSDTSNGTMSSELLDDYEEGTWTPSVTMSGGDHGLGYEFRYGTYTKIGRKVYVEAYVKLNAISSNGSGYMKLVGLPFNSINSSTYGGMHCPYYNSLNNQIMRGALIERNDNFAFVYYDIEGSAAGGTIQNATIAALFGTTSQFVLIGSYQTP